MVSHLCFTVLWQILSAQVWWWIMFLTKYVPTQSHVNGWRGWHVGLLKHAVTLKMKKYTFIKCKDWCVKVLRSWVLSEQVAMNSDTRLNGFIDLAVVCCCYRQPDKWHSCGQCRFESNSQHDTFWSTLPLFVASCLSYTALRATKKQLLKGSGSGKSHFSWFLGFFYWNQIKRWSVMYKNKLPCFFFIAWPAHWYSTCLQQCYLQA